MVLESVDRNGAREIVKVAALVIIACFSAALENSQSQSIEGAHQIDGAGYYRVFQCRVEMVPNSLTVVISFSFFGNIRRICVRLISHHFLT